MAYNNNLQDFLQNKGITQSEVSLGTRTSNVTINKICRKKLSPSRTLIGKITQYLVNVKNCTVDEIEKALPMYVAKVREEIAEKKGPIKEKIAKIKDTAEAVVEEVKEKKATATKKIKEIAKDMEGKVDDLKEAAAPKVKKAKETAEKVIDKAQDIVEDIIEKLD
jgi:transcriptional regulator with XRE-family HTH domain